MKTLCFPDYKITKPLPDTLYQVGVYAMWLGLLLDTIETRQGEGDAFWEEGDAFCIAGVGLVKKSAVGKHPKSGTG